MKRLQNRQQERLLKEQQRELKRMQRAEKKLSQAAERRKGWPGSDVDEYVALHAGKVASTHSDVLSSVETTDALPPGGDCLQARPEEVEGRTPRVAENHVLNGVRIHHDDNGKEVIEPDLIILYRRRSGWQR